MKETEKKKVKKAVALSYNEQANRAPIVKAKGSGIIAENIMKTAVNNNVPIVEDQALIELLKNVEINETIPEELYMVVAEVFAFIYKMDSNAKGKNN